MPIAYHCPEEVIATISGWISPTALGSLLLNLLASLAEFELEMIRERVKAGMDRAKKQGRLIGRPKV